LVRHSSKVRDDGVLGLDLGDFEKFLFTGGDDDINVNLHQLNPLTPQEARSIARSALPIQSNHSGETTN